MSLFWEHCSVKMGSSGAFKGQISKHWFPEMGPFSWLGPSLLGVKKMKLGKEGNHSKHPMGRPNIHVVYGVCFEEMVSYPRKVVHRKKCIYFSKWASSFCTVFSAICGTVAKNKNGPQAQFRFLGEVKMCSSTLLRIQGKGILGGCAACV